MENDMDDPNITMMLDDTDFGIGEVLPEDVSDTNETPAVSPSDIDSGSVAQFEPEINVMSTLRQPTYYFKFYALNDLNPQEGVNEVIIAETGRTAMNINDVSIEGIVGPNIQTRNSMATTFNIRMSEPLGMNLPDRMVAAARKLRIRNYLKTPFYLKMKLQGFDNGGNPSVVGEWRWRLMITDLKSTVTEAGAEHSMTAIPYPEVALQNQIGMLPVNVSVEGQTVGDVLNEIANALNANMEERHGYHYVKYIFEDIPYPEGLAEGGISRPFEHKVVPDKLINHNERSEGDDGTRAHFSQGTDIPAIVDAIFSASNTAVALATLERDAQPKEATEDNVSALKPSSVFHRVETEVSLTKYDPALGDYAKEVKFVIRPYESSRIHTNIRNVSSSQAQDIGARKIHHALKRSFLKKQYDYIFTGKNTEIEKFDMEINFRWAVSAPMFYQDRVAVATSYDTTTIPRYYNPSEVAANMATRTNRLSELQTSITDAEAEITNNPEMEAEELSAIRDKITTYNTEITQLREQQAKDAELRRASLQDADEFEDGEEEVILAEDMGQEWSEVQTNPITIMQDSEDPTLQSGVGLPVRSDGTKSVYGVMLNQLYGSFDGNLQSIKLEVRGDPYWLGPDPTSSGNSNMIEGASANSGNDLDAPNFMNGEHIFAFNFGLPQGFDSTTGSVKLSRDEVYSGFYAVAKIEHRFQGGKFTQILDAVRITGVNFDDLNKKIQEESSDPVENEDVGLPEIVAPPVVEVLEPITVAQVTELSTRFNPTLVTPAISEEDEDDGF